MKEIYTIMTATLGVPPKPDEKISWDYYDEDGKAGHWEGTPKQFLKAFSSKAYPPAESFSLINDPRNAYSTLYTVDRLCNVWGGRHASCESLLSVIPIPNLFRFGNYTPNSLHTNPTLQHPTDVNTPISTLKHAVVRMLQAGQPVFFGCDVGKCSDRASGVMDARLVAGGLEVCFFV